MCDAMNNNSTKHKDIDRLVNILSIDKIPRQDRESNIINALLVITSSKN
jgi:hypothetical protein